MLPTENPDNPPPLNPPEIPQSNYDSDEPRFPSAKVSSSDSSEKPAQSALHPSYRRGVVAAAPPPENMPKFKFIHDLPRLCTLIEIPPETANLIGVPIGTAQYLPDQTRLELWIFEKYIQYRRSYKAFDIFQNIREQLRKLHECSVILHPHWLGILQNIQNDLFPYTMPRPDIKGFPKPRPVRKFCIGCHKLLPVNLFIVMRANFDSFSRLCIRCKNDRDNGNNGKKPKQPKPQLTKELEQPTFDAESLDTLDNPTHAHSHLESDLFSNQEQI